MASKQKEDVYSDRSEYRRTEVCTSQVVIRRRVHDGVDCAGLTFYYFLQESSWCDRFIKVLYVSNYFMFNDFI